MKKLIMSLLFIFVLFPTFTRADLQEVESDLHIMNPSKPEEEFLERQKKVKENYEERDSSDMGERLESGLGNYTGGMVERLKKVPGEMFSRILKSSGGTNFPKTFQKKVQWLIYLPCMRLTLLRFTYRIWLVFFTLGLFEGLLRRRKNFFEGIAYYSDVVFQGFLKLTIFLVILLSVGYVFSPVSIPTLPFLFVLASVIGWGTYKTVSSFSMKM